MSDNQIVYTPPKTVKEFLLDQSFAKCIQGPVGSGKSTGCIMALVMNAKQQLPGPDGIRRSRYAIIRNTAQQLKDTTLKSFLDWFRNAGVWKESEKVFTLKFADIESEFLFRALDTPDDTRRLLSLELTGAYINEAREIPEEIFTAVKSRVGRYPPKKDGVGATYPFIIMDTNPPDIDSWIYDIFEVKKPENMAIFKQPSGISPEAENVENLPDNYYENIMDGASQEFIDVHVHGLYGRSKAGKPVWLVYSDHMHLNSTAIRPIKKRPLIIGLDFGLTPAAVFKQRDVWNHVVTLDELWAEDMGLKRFWKTKVDPLLNDKYKGFEIIVIGDPAGKKRDDVNEISPFQWLKKKGFAVYPAPTNDIAPRLEATETLLSTLAEDGRPMWLLSPNCAHLRTAMRGGYKYKKLKGSGGYTATPDKNEFSHIADANQYGDMFFTSGMKVKGSKSKQQDAARGRVVADRVTGY